MTLPVDSPWALPPVLVLQSRTGGRASPALRRWVLHLKRLALSPAARRSVQSGKASAGALKLLAAFPRTNGPLLVLSRGRAQRARAGDDAVDDAHGACAAVPTMPSTPAAARGSCSSPSRPIASTSLARRAPSRVSCARSSASIAPRATSTASTGAFSPPSTASRRTSASNTHVSSAGAVGWMQFMPSTWRRWGTDASGDGVADPYDPQDAIFSAARYLDAAGARKDLRRAIFAYNHANWYVNEILSIAASLPDELRQLDTRELTPAASRAVEPAAHSA